MSVLVLGLSHNSADLGLLERVCLDRAGVRALGADLAAVPDLGEVLVLSTCNRVEVYAEANTFHAAVEAVATTLAKRTGIALAELQHAAYVHYDERAVSHLFEVATGLDSMAVGEAEILGQLKSALAQAQEAGWAGPSLNALIQHGLRVGKRAHSETGIDAVSVGFVQAGLARAQVRLGPISQLRVAVVGAGAMSGLATASIARHDPRSLTVVNRSAERAERLAAAAGADPAPWTALAQVLEVSDLVVTCTGAQGHVVSGELARRARLVHGGPQVYLDLAMPRDVAPGVEGLPDVELHWLDDLAGDTRHTASAPVDEVRALVADEVARFLQDRRHRAVGPTVAALRARAGALVGAELDLLDARLPHLDEQARHEIRRTVSRVVDKLLHAPTVRVKELGHRPAGDYARALRELFDLDPGAVVALISPEPSEPSEPSEPPSSPEPSEPAEAPETEGR